MQSHDVLMLKMLQQSHLAKQLFCVLPLSTQVATATLYPFYCHNLTALLMILRSDELAKSASSNRSQNFVARMQTCELGYEGGMVGKKVVTPRTLHLCRCEFKMNAMLERLVCGGLGHARGTFEAT